MRDEREAQEPMAAGAAEWLIHVQSTADAASTSPGSPPLIQLAMRGQFPGHSAGRSEWIHWLRGPFLRLNALHTLGRALHSHDALRLNPTPFPLRANDRWIGRRSTSTCGPDPRPDHQGNGSTCSR